MQFSPSVKTKRQKIFLTTLCGTKETVKKVIYIKMTKQVWKEMTKQQTVTVSNNTVFYATKSPIKFHVNMIATIVMREMKCNSTIGSNKFAHIMILLPNNSLFSAASLHLHSFFLLYKVYSSLLWRCNWSLLLLQQHCCNLWLIDSLPQFTWHMN